VIKPLVLVLVLVLSRSGFRSHRQPCYRCPTFEECICYFI